MQFNKAILLFTALLLPVLFNQGCTNCINGSGNTVTILRQTAGFSSVIFGTEGTVYISRDSITSIKIVTQQDIADDLVTSVNNGELNIYNRHCLRSNSNISIFITTPDLNAVQMDGSGDLYVTGTVSADAFDVFLSGSGNIYMSDSLIAKSVGVTLSGSGDITLSAYCNSLHTTISGSGSITLSGESGNHTINTSGSGDIHSYGIITDTTNSTISGSGNQELFVNDLLDVTISGSGDVFYKGNALLTTHISGSGNVTHVN